MEDNKKIIYCEILKRNGSLITKKKKKNLRKAQNKPKQNRKRENKNKETGLHNNS